MHQLSPSLYQNPSAPSVPAATTEPTTMPHVADDSLSIDNSHDTSHTNRPPRERQKPSYLKDFHCSAVANVTLPTPKSSQRTGDAIIRVISQFKSIAKSAFMLPCIPSVERESIISEISEYNPLDLFSGSKDRMHKAIKALFVTPQNNFRVFLNGSLILGGLGGGADSTTCMIGEAFENVLNGVIQADVGQRTSNFLHLVTEAISGSGLLDRLLEVQKLDNIDIEGAIHAYYNLVCQPCIACRDLGGEKLSARYAYLHSMSSDESLKIVRDYLIAATAKDLSLMISFRTREDRDVESPYNGVFLDSTNQRFEYKVCSLSAYMV
ncbi:hypothetical protein RHSIM_Rhsim07G0021500 [Rhododendron simsii]|uniref:Inositol-pentakisphosphate 2-kinase n=1 Tax=Rhododendron simsii TaxID=118357 RepID=A0A834GV06_RHOSS|nr:hypothetical protein RHSIM_Rhsim07G0021500 [Rhododendron simsii]